MVVVPGGQKFGFKLCEAKIEIETSTDQESGLGRPVRIREQVLLYYCRLHGKRIYNDHIELAENVGVGAPHWVLLGQGGAGG